MGKEKINKSTYAPRIGQYCLFALMSWASLGICTAQNLDSLAVPDVNQAKVTGLRYISIHVLQLEKSLELYREILGFELTDAEVLKGPSIEGMLVMILRADELEIRLSLTAPELMHTIGPVGNTNHNHFMLIVNDIGPIGDKLKAAGYKLENENYVRDKYTFFEGPNGEIIGLSAW
ncbi:MAG: VOC family protein [Bacteroidota bacterium]